MSAQLIEADEKKYLSSYMKSAQRSWVYYPDRCEEVIKYAMDGLRVMERCAAMRVPYFIYTKWLEIHEEFFDASTFADNLCQAWWLEQGRINLKNKEFNNTNWYMTMKNCWGWSDKTEQKTTVHISQEQALKELE